MRSSKKLFLLAKFFLIGQNISCQEKTKKAAGINLSRSSIKKTVNLQGKKQAVIRSEIKKAG